jgi:hypothetical protein
MSWITKLQERWKVGSIFQVVMILIVFACTGFTVLFLKRPVFTFLFGEGDIPVYASVIYYILILPIYNLFLLLYGFIFGQFTFFWNFEKRFFNRLTSILNKNK